MYVLHLSGEINISYIEYEQKLGVNFFKKTKNPKQPLKVEKNVVKTILYK